ncbi:MAG: hypothetical protein JWN76_311 [Chitinophagaceae bacterium]|nr:hypothetical protein [Chitinophagaceae bacterium]
MQIFTAMLLVYQLSKVQIFLFQLSHNPYKEKIDIQIQSSKETDAEILLLNMDGRKLAGKKIHIPAGTSHNNF